MRLRNTIPPRKRLPPSRLLEPLPATPGLAPCAQLSTCRPPPFASCACQSGRTASCLQPPPPWADSLRRLLLVAVAVAVALAAVAVAVAVVAGQGPVRGGSTTTLGAYAPPPTPTPPAPAFHGLTHARAHAMTVVCPRLKSFKCAHILTRSSHVVGRFCDGRPCKWRGAGARLCGACAL